MSYYTSAGQDLMAQATAGKTKIKFTRGAASSTNWSGKTKDELIKMTALANENQVTSIGGITVEKNDDGTTSTEEIAVDLIFDQSKIVDNRDYQMYVIGLFACPTDGKTDGTEILYSVTVLSSPQAMYYDRDGSTQTFRIITAVGDTTQLSITLDGINTGGLDQAALDVVHQQIEKDIQANVNDQFTVIKTDLADDIADMKQDISDKDSAQTEYVKSAVAVESGARSGADSTETVARKQADSAESSARTAADSALDKRVAANSAAISVAQAAAEKYADSGIAVASTAASSGIVSEAKTRSDADEKETQARANADTTESSARAAADTKLQTSATANATAAAKAQTTASNASSAVVNEATARSAMDVKLQGSATANSAAAAKAQSTANGKLPNAQQIPGNVDLNDYRTAGIYVCNLTANAKTLKNCPTTIAFTLIVASIDKQLVTQELIEYNPVTASRAFVRSLADDGKGTGTITASVWKPYVLANQDTTITGKYSFTQALKLNQTGAGVKSLIQTNLGQGDKNPLTGLAGTNVNGDAIALGAGGVTLIGSGESAQNILNDMAAGKLPANLAAIMPSGDTEIAAVAGDSDVYIITNLQNNDATSKLFKFGKDGSLNAPGTVTQNGAVVATQAWAKGAFAVKKSVDTRKTNQNPLWYIQNHGYELVREFKNAADIGITAAMLPTGQKLEYVSLTTDVPFTDNTGGYPTQIARTTRTSIPVTLERIGVSNTAWSKWHLVPIIERG